MLLLAVLAVPLVLAQSSSSDVVLRPGRLASVHGGWSIVSDATAAEGVAVRHPNAGGAKLSNALAAPVHYFEVTFDADAQVPYRVWLRASAQGDYWGNDSVFLQFSGSLDDNGAAAYRIGTSSSLVVNLEDCSGCGLSGWGWQDTGWGVGVLGPTVSFESAGEQRLRIQTREDGLTIDQIVLSPQRYLTSAPGALKNDTTIVPTGGGAPAVTVVRRPYLQQMSSSGVVVVWATREAGTPGVRLTGGTSATVTGTSRRVPSSVNGLGYDYYHHEVTLTGLEAATAYSYETRVDDAEVAQASFRTAPARGTGAFSFIAFGDSGTGSTDQRDLAALMANDTFDLALHTGDIAYGNSRGTGDATFGTYNDWFFGMYSAWLPYKPFFPSEGNHDSRPSNGDGVAYLDSYVLPRNGGSAAYPDHAERYYSFDYGPVHFVALDTEFAFQDSTRRAEQLSWLESDLAGTSQPWKIAFFHRSPYSAGGEHGSDLAVRSAFAPLFEQYGVQLALSSHEHDYERTHPQTSGGGAGVTYVVTGGGGGPLYLNGTESWTAFSAARHHYLKVDVSACTLDVRAIGSSGSPFDSTTISRCGSPPPPPPSGTREVVLYAAEAPVVNGGWRVESDSAAAGGNRLRHPNAGGGKLSSALASPQHYFEMTFDAEAGVPYRIWIRGKADGDHWGNDSIFVQFDRSVNSSGSPMFRIGSTDSTPINLEECSGCRLSNWGWEDNGWGRGVLGPQIYFSASGQQRLRIQTREDGLAIDQIAISPAQFLTASPGSTKDDTTILTRP